MQTWLNFWNLFFWFCLTSFLFNNLNIIRLIFLSECIWVIIYVYSLFLGVLNDDLNLFITSFFVLGLAGLEFSVGLFLIVFFRNINKTLLLNDTNKTINDFTQSNNNLFYINRFLWVS